MLQKRSSARGGQIRMFVTLIFASSLSISSAHAAENPCSSALPSTQGVLALQPDSPVTVTSAVAEWESEILKLHVSQPGVLSLSTADGAEAEGYLLALGTSGARLVNGAPLDPRSPLLTPVDPREVYCLRVVPRPGAGGPLRVRIELIDLCKLRPHPDDHGDSFACATEMRPGSRRAGSISPGDRDVFAFSLESAGTVELQSQGTAGTSGQLFDEAGTLLVAADGGRSGSGFRISAVLPAGRYFVRVESANGAAGTYTLRFNSSL